MSRVYEGGHSTKGWKRGKKVMKISDVKVGDILIGICHNFRSENLYKVIPFENPNRPDRDLLFYAQYCKPNRHLIEPDNIHCVWHHDLTLPGEEWYFAEKVKSKEYLMLTDTKTFYPLLMQRSKELKEQYEII